jgi:WD40 repeat protein
VLDARTRERVSRIVLDPPSGSSDHETTGSTAWSPDGAKLYIGAEGTAHGDDGAIVVVDPRTGEVLDRVELGFGPQAMELRQDGDELVAVQNALADGEVEEPIAAVLDSTTLKRKRDFPLGNVGMAFDVSYSPDGSRLAVVGDQGVLGVFDAATGEPVHPPVRVHNAVAFQVEWLPDGRTVVTTAADGRVSLYDADRACCGPSPSPPRPTDRRRTRSC